MRHRELEAIQAAPGHGWVLEIQNSGIIASTAKNARGVVDQMIANVRRLVIAHFALGLASVLVYWARPGAVAPHFHSPPWGFALIVILKVFLAWIPYIISGAYSCDLLPARNPKATFVFIAFAIGVGVIAACLNLSLSGMSQAPAPWLVSAGVTIVLIAAARLCASIWLSDVSDWDSNL